METFGFVSSLQTFTRSMMTPHEGVEWQDLIVPVRDARGLKKKSDDMKPDHLNDLGSQGCEAVGLSLRSGDLFDWPVVLLKRVNGRGAESLVTTGIDCPKWIGIASTERQFGSALCPVRWDAGDGG